MLVSPQFGRVQTDAVFDTRQQAVSLAGQRPHPD